MRPDRIVVGLETEKAKELISTLYRPLFLLETPVIFTSLETSELIKYASNAFLAVKILGRAGISSMKNEIAVGTFQPFLRGHL